jgi:hypothetical protein
MEEGWHGLTIDDKNLEDDNKSVGNLSINLGAGPGLRLRNHVGSC